MHPMNDVKVHYTLFRILHKCARSQWLKFNAVNGQSLKIGVVNGQNAKKS